MTIRILGKDDIPANLELSYLGYPTIRDYTDEGVADYTRQLELITDDASGVSAYGGFIDDRLVAIARAFDFEMNVYGQMTKVSGYGTLAVHPLYKKSGLAARLTAYYEDQAKQQGIDTTCLLPFRPDYYEQKGYGFSTKMELYQVDLKYCPDYSGPYEVRLIESVDELFHCHDHFTRQTHGMVRLLGLEKDHLRREFKGLQTTFIGVYQAERLVGYTSYRIKSLIDGNYTKNYIKANDIIVRDAQSLRAILGFFRRQSDLAEYVEFHTQIPGITHLFSNPLDRSGGYIANGYLQSNRQAVGLMLKIIDPARWLERHGDRLSMPPLTWDIEGEIVGRGPHRVSLKRSHLSSLWYGAISFLSLYRLGLIECDEATAERLRRTFPGDDPPQNNTDF